MSSVNIFRPNNREKYSIVIPAAGLGKRLKSVGPKCLAQINHETILARQLRLIDFCFNYYEVIVVGGFQIEKLDKYTNNKVKVVNNKDYEDTNVLHSINIGLKKVKKEKVVIIYGDLIFNQESINLPFHDKSAVVVANGMKEEEVGVVSKEFLLENMFYGLKDKWAQISYFTGFELETLKNIANKYSDWFGFESINHILSMGGNFSVLSHPNAQAVDIDSSYDLKRVNENFNKTQSISF